MRVFHYENTETSFFVLPLSSSKLFLYERPKIIWDLAIALGSLREQLHEVWSSNGYTLEYMLNIPHNMPVVP